jgi:DhnA family fructose-bisphosphate aldolase class Ia
MKMIEGAMKAGAAGLSIGRNAFQHKNPELFVRTACEIVHNNMSADEALKMLRRG